ncbi:MAG: amidase [Promethearchaeota archaeon]
MNRTDLCFQSCVATRDAIAGGDVSAVDVLEAFVDRIERLNPKVNAYCTLTLEAAREQAEAADRRVRAGEPLPPLNGVPVSIKDLMPVAGVRTTYGSKIYEHHVPTETDVAAGRLVAAGAVVLGKTNTPEFGYGGITDNAVFGPTLNPWDLGRTPGGSSGGAGASVAAGMGPLALGSDGGGSIRHPACFCGVVGLKPQFGRVPAHPRLGVLGETLSQHGPLARHVEDVVLAMDVIAGPDPRDRHSLPAPGVSYLDALSSPGGPPAKLDVAFLPRLGYAKAVDPDVEKLVRDAVAKFEELGWRVDEPRFRLRNPEPCFYALWTAMYAHDLGPKLKNWRDRMDPNLVKLVEAGSTATAVDLARATAERRRLYDSVARLLAEYDLLVTPTTAVPAFEVGRMFPEQVAGRNVSPTGWMPFTFPFNLTGHPAVTLPAGFAPGNLPVGVQLVGRRYDEVTVLRAARAYEGVAGWQDARPPL